MLIDFDVALLLGLERNHQVVLLAPADDRYTRHAASMPDQFDCIACVKQ